VLIGGNADEATVFGHGPATIAEYRKYLEADSGAFADQEFRAWPAALDADVPMQYLQLQSDSFAYGAWSLATSMTRAGEPAYLYRFTWRNRATAQNWAPITVRSLHFWTTPSPAIGAPARATTHLERL
jgi:hypothetical protein